MNDFEKEFTVFSKPLIDALKNTFSVMMETGITPNTPHIKEGVEYSGDITAIISLDGEMEKDGINKKFRGHISVSFEEEVFVKVASKMLMTEYTEICDEIADAGAEIMNIVIGNAKRDLSEKGYKIAMASPITLVKGETLEFKYEKKTTSIETKIDSDLGDFVFEICYQDVA